MSFTIQTAVVNVSGSVTSTETSYTVSALSASYSDNAAHTLGTVGAGKRWRILGIQGTVTGGAGAGALELEITLNGVTFFNIDIQGIATYPTGVASNTVMFYPTAAPIITAGQTVVLTARSATHRVAVTVYYSEEAV